MKLRNLFPFVSAKRHQQEVAQRTANHEADNRYLVDQLKQATKRNLQLEAELADREGNIANVRKG